MEGDSFRASISIAAFDSTQTPTIIVTDVFIGDTLPDYTNGDTIPVRFNGKGNIVFLLQGLELKNVLLKSF